LGDGVNVFGGGAQENGKVHSKYTALEPLAVESAASITATVPLVALGPERWTKSSVEPGVDDPGSMVDASDLRVL
jgi:hypothetical protein